MPEMSDALPGATEADLQEQGNAAPLGTTASGTQSPGGGTGGSEADLQEQAEPAESTATTDGDIIAGQGTGGSEADRLEQAADVPLDGEDAFPHGAVDDDPVE